MNPLAARYLYGLDEPLPRPVVEAYMTTLVRVAQANGIVESESRVLQGVADSIGAPPFLLARLLGTEELDFQPWLDELQGRPALMTTLYRDAILVARADGHVSDEEIELLERVSVQLGLTADQRRRATEGADLLEDVRRGLRET